MKTKFIIPLFIFMIVSFSSLYAQGFQPPAEGKAVVYFARVTTFGGLVSFEYFDRDKYIGIFKGKNYMRYECEPGENLLWASSENKEFLTANLTAGETYIVIVNIEMGIGKARVGLEPITPAKKEEFERAKELIKKEPPVVTSEAKIKEMNIKLKDFIAEKLKMYEEQWKAEKDFKHISADMAIPKDQLQ